MRPTTPPPSAPDDADDPDDLDDPLVREIGARIREARRRRGLSLADVEGTSAGRWRASTLGAYERGVRKPSVGVLHHLAAFFDVTVPWLLGVDQPVPAPPPVGTVRIDLQAPATAHLDRHVLRVLRQITIQRGGPVPRFLAVRNSDLELLAATLGVDLRTFVQDLRNRGVVADPAVALSQAG